jgi:hypothetical protein
VHEILQPTACRLQLMCHQVQDTAAMAARAASLVEAGTVWCVIWQQQQLPQRTV